MKEGFVNLAPETSFYQTNRKQTCILNFNAPGFTTTKDTDEQRTRDEFFNHRERTTGDYLKG